MVTKKVLESASETDDEDEHIPKAEAVKEEKKVEPLTKESPATAAATTAATMMATSTPEAAAVKSKNESDGYVNDIIKK